ncbi:glycogen debranching protein GlgX [Dermabacteraceae bacterium P13077]
MNLTSPPAPGMRVDAHGNGTFSVYAPRAEAVDLCVIENGCERRQRLSHYQGGFWWDRVSRILPGTEYGLRAHGNWDPASGDFFNPDMLLLDPYAGGVISSGELVPEMFPFPVDDMLHPLGTQPQQQTDSPLRSVHVPLPAYEGPQVALEWADTVFYELHVKGFTAQAEFLPAELRGTYAGLAHPATQEYLRALGVTTLELLPIHAGLNEPHLARMGMGNYWGYSTLSYFAPHPGYATAAARAQGPQAVAREVRQMVRDLHAGGFEVVLDVVYNHTCEGGSVGPSVCFKGLGAQDWYWLDQGRFHDVTGTGNTLNVLDTAVNAMILDSLRLWAGSYGVDGFRFDLAATLGRTGNGFRAQHPLLSAMLTDPLLRTRKMVAEPWDVGWDGWQTGNFAPGFAEWNDSFRDDIRSLWLSARAARRYNPQEPQGGVRNLATRLSGSADIFTRRDPIDNRTGRSTRSPWASINFVTAHDGFTLHDLTAYEQKHNYANGEENRDGSNNNRSYNHGFEGEVPATHEASQQIQQDRFRTQRAILATLLLSAGTPLLTAGDEVSRTQGGNNNAYCQDNEISWFSWDWDSDQRDLFDFTAKLLKLRKHYPQLRCNRFLSPLQQAKPGGAEVGWVTVQGRELSHDDWVDGAASTLLALRPGMDGAHLAFAFNLGEERVRFAPPRTHGEWTFTEILLSSSPQEESGIDPDGWLSVPAGTVTVVNVSWNTANAVTS